MIRLRYEKGSILLTSNRAPTEWPAVFGDGLIASAALDRLTTANKTAAQTAGENAGATQSTTEALLAATKNAAEAALEESRSQARQAKGDAK